MSKLLNGSICFSDLVEAAKEKHSAFKKADNGKVYFNLTVWINDEKDKYGNDAAIQIRPAKDGAGEKKYIGNLKYPEKLESTNEDILEGVDLSGLPF